MEDLLFKIKCKHDPHKWLYILILLIFLGLGIGFMTAGILTKTPYRIVIAVFDYIFLIQYIFFIPGPSVSLYKNKLVYRNLERKKFVLEGTPDTLNVELYENNLKKVIRVYYGDGHSGGIDIKEEFEGLQEAFEQNGAVIISNTDKTDVIDEIK